jgi:hypothetical protein
MKKYTIRKGRSGRRRLRNQKQTRSKKYSRRRLRYGGVSKRSRATPPRASSRSASLPPTPPPPSKAPSRSAKPAGGLLVFKNGVSLQSMRTAGISKADAQVSKADAQVSKADAQVSKVVRLIANFPYDMDKFLEMVIYNHNLLSDNDVKIALRNKISINMFPATGRLSTNGIIFISYICGKLNHLLEELSRTNVAKKSQLLRKIKQIERVIYLLDDVGCSWGVRPYNAHEMKTIYDYYIKYNNDEAGLQEYYSHLNALIDTYFPDFKVHQDPSRVVSSSMARLLISQRVINTLPDIHE